METIESKLIEYLKYKDIKVKSLEKALPNIARITVYQKLKNRKQGKKFQCFNSEELRQISNFLKIGFVILPNENKIIEGLAASKVDETF